MYLFWNVFDIKISVYLICACVGLIISIFVICSKLLKKGLVHKYIFVILQAFPGIFIGSKSFGISCTILSNIFIYHKPLTWGDIVHSGIVYYGGLLGYLLLVFLICKIKKLEFDKLSNILAVGIPIFHCFGRIGCYFAGCCYGIVSTSAFAVPYRIYGSTVWENRVPVQLIEAGFELMLFTILNYTYNAGEHYQLNTRKTALLRLYLLKIGRAHV